MDKIEKELLEIAIHKSGKEFYNFLSLLLKKINNNKLKAVIAIKKEEIRNAKREQQAAIYNLELKRTLKEYLRKNEVKEYIRLCSHNTYIEI
jgi:aromatic ring-opening dioxygenase LigB subunit